MKFIKPILFLILLVIASQVYSQVPPEPGTPVPTTTVKSNVKQKGPGNNPPDPGGNTPPVQVPLDGGLLLALLAGGSVSALFLKRKNKEKE